MSELLLIAISALLLQSAFMWPAYCAWMVFVFLIPLLYAMVFGCHRQSFLKGVVWGVIFFGTHFFALFLVFYEKAQGSLRILAPVLFMLYCSIYPGIWFFLNAYIARGKSKLTQLFLWGVGAGIYFYAVSNTILWPSGMMVGYCFGSPLLPLAHYPQFLVLLREVSAQLLIVSLIGLQIAILLFFLQRFRPHILLCIVLCAFPFTVGWFFSKSPRVPEYLSTICYAKPPARNVAHPLEQAEEINMNIIKALQFKPCATCILMPESSLTHNLNQLPEIVEMWGINCLANGHTLCIGSYRADTKNEYNSLYLVKECRIMHCYDKLNLMPFVEYLPSFYKKISWIKGLFLKDINEFSPNKNCRPSITLTNNFTIKPYLCSDMYISNRMEEYEEADKQLPHTPILLAVNDSWYSAFYAKHLMFLYAVYHALCSSTDILYVGHTFGCWIDSTTGKTILF